MNDRNTHITSPQPEQLDPSQHSDPSKDPIWRIGNLIISDEAARGLGQLPLSALPHAIKAACDNARDDDRRVVLLKDVPDV